MIRSALLTGAVAGLVVAGTPSVGAQENDDDDVLSGTVTVSMNHFEFAPREIKVEPGTTVVWTYDADPADPQPNCESPYVQDPSPVQCPGHSTTSFDEGAGGEPLWDSGVHRADGFPFEVTFADSGDFAYFCTVHGGPDKNNPLTDMEGLVTVVASDDSGDGGGSGAGGGDDGSSGGPGGDDGAAGEGDQAGTGADVADVAGVAETGAQGAQSSGEPLPATGASGLGLAFIVTALGAMMLWRRGRSAGA